MSLHPNRTVKFIDLELVSFQAAWDFQTQLFNSTLGIKTANRTLAVEEQTPTENFLIFCQHPHVYTLGKSGKESNLLVKPENLAELGASYYHINRGGDITYHGPGQLVGYPVLDLENFFTDIHRYMRLLEESIIRTLKVFGIESGRIPDLTGVWVDHQRKARKICALGVKTSRWVTLHGFALNINTDLSYFDHIVPCGISDKAVTSLEKEVGHAVEIDLVKEILKDNIAEVFEMNLIR